MKKRSSRHQDGISGNIANGEHLQRTVPPSLSELIRCSLPSVIMATSDVSEWAVVLAELETFVRLGMQCRHRPVRESGLEHQ
jgi:hypothetical protein